MSPSGVSRHGGGNAQDSGLQFGYFLPTALWKECRKSINVASNENGRGWSIMSPLVQHWNLDGGRFRRSRPDPPRTADSAFVPSMLHMQSSAVEPQTWAVDDRRQG